MARRQKAQGATTIESWDQADDTVGRIGALTREIEKQGAAASEKISAAKAKLKKDAAGKIAQRTALLHDLEMFAELHREDLGAKKSRELNHGVLGFRKSSKIITRKVADILKKVKRFIADRLIPLQ